MINKRRQFLGKIGALGLGTLLPFKKELLAQTLDGDGVPEACTLMNSETRGPFPLFDASAISSQSALVRSDIKETQTGVPLTLTITVQNTACTPIPNAKVYIWHCTKAGVYSGYNNAQNPGTVGSTYLRGIQTTNSSGQVTFNTIHPGWYNGRLTHIHAEVYVNNVLILTSQFAFPLDSVSGSTTQLANAANGQGNNTITSYSGDNVFSDGYTGQLLTITGSVAAGFTASHVFTMNYTLPLKIISFTGGVENKTPMLWWTTENEINVSHFEVEQSTHPSKNFEQAGTVKARNQTSINNYSFSLQSPLPAEITYFRLKMVDTDGRVNYSGVVTIHTETVEKMKLVNTYATDQLIIKHPSTYSNSVLKIVSLSGQMVATGKLKTGVSLTSININNIKEGAYLLIIESGIDRYVTKFYKGH